MPARPATLCEVSIGDLSVTFVPDGYILGSATRSYPGTSDALWAEHSEYLDDEGFLVMSLGCLLVRSGEELVLVDLGWGPGTATIGPEVPGVKSGRAEGGWMLENLAKVNVKPEDVSSVVFSHLHRDHTGWIVDPSTSTDDPAQPGMPTFPNATHYLSGAEWDYWTGGETSGPAPSLEQQAVLGSRLELVEDGTVVAPGVQVMSTPGHTPGHLSFVISSGSERAIVLGDAVHCPIEILMPELTFIVDVDPAMAQRTRVHIEQELERPGTIAAGAHFPDLVFGRLMTSDGRLGWSFSDSQVLSS